MSGRALNAAAIVRRPVAAVCRGPANVCNPLAIAILQAQTNVLRARVIAAGPEQRSRTGQNLLFELQQAGKAIFPASSLTE